MGRRRKNDLPELRCHKGRARLRYEGKEYSCGPFGSPESFAERDRILLEILRGRAGQLPATSTRPQQGIVQVPAASPPLALPEPSLAVQHELPRQRAGFLPSASGQLPQAYPTPSPVAVATDEITVGELALKWIDYILRERCKRGKNRTSLYYTARQAANALEPYWELPASQFGPLALKEVQKTLATTPCTSRPKDPKKPSKSKPRVRQGVNSVVDRIRALFKFGVLIEVITAEQSDRLRAVPGLKKTQVDNFRGVKNERACLVEGNRKRAVADELVNATLPHLPPAIVDLLLFQRITGCRPGEARTLRPCDIDRRPLPEHQGTWIWKPSEWKLSHLEDIADREIVIPPEAQDILAPWLAALADTPDRFVFSPRRRERPASQTPLAETRGRAPRCRRSRKQRTNDHYSKDSLNRAIKRACEQNNLTPWTSGQLRHTRLTEVRQKKGLEAAQAVGGHSNFSQTEHYADIQRQKAIEVALDPQPVLRRPNDSA
jgi:integrase